MKGQRLTAADWVLALFQGAGRVLACALLLSSILIFAAACDNSDTSSAKSPSPDAKLETSPAIITSSSTNGGRYALGTVIRFGAGGGSEAFRQNGWSETETNATWTTGNSARLVFNIDPIDQPLTLWMSLAALSGMTNSTQPVPLPVEVVANGQKIADWDVTVRADFNAVIPAANLNNGGALVIELKTPTATSPKAMGISNDARVLGVYCFELAISKKG